MPANQDGMRFRLAHSLLAALMAGGCGVSSSDDSSGEDPPSEPTPQEGSRGGVLAGGVAIPIEMPAG